MTYTYDAETSLDHTQFRQYTSQLARWITPDPAGLLVADPSNPQSWNRYSYVLNNPLRFIDPLGLGCVDKTGSIITDDHGEENFTNQPACENGGGRWIPPIPPDTVTVSATPPPDFPTTDFPLPSQLPGGVSGGNTSGNSSGGLFSALTKNFLNLDVCIEKNAENFSIGGVLNLTTGVDLPFLGNQVTDTAIFLTGQAGLADSASGAAGLGKDAFKALNSPITTNGPNSLTTLNPMRGSPQPVLGNGTNYKSFAGKAGKALGKATAIADLGLSGALVVDCLTGQVK